VNVEFGFQSSTPKTRYRGLQAVFAFSWIALGAVMLTPIATGASPDASTNSINAEVIGAFQAICVRQRPRFAEIDARAAARGMQVQDDQTTHSPDGAVTRRKTWTGDLASGPFGLMLDETAGRKVTIASCAIFGAAVSDADAFRMEIVRALRLPAPGAAQFEAGLRSFEWEAVAGPGTALVLRDLSPADKPGIIVKLIVATVFLE
jgi:hypothetical protein